MKALSKQEAGDHYRLYKIQPIEYIVSNGLSFLAGNIIKYATRYKNKGGAQDIRKIIHYCELILEFEYPGSLDLEASPEPALSPGSARAAAGEAVSPTPLLASPKTHPVPPATPSQSSSQSSLVGQAFAALRAPTDAELQWVFPPAGASGERS